MTSAVCPTMRDGDDEVARQWAAGTLSADAATEFERHMLTCPTCQRAVENAAGITAALRAAAHSHPAVKRVRWQAWSIAALAAAGLALVLWPRDALRSLAHPGAPPAYAPVTIRAAADTSDDGSRGMVAYQARDFGTAARLLGAATRNESSRGLEFFLGVSRLLSGDAAGAVAPLDNVARDETSPYGAEAQLWLAKAWLRLGQVDSSLRVLGTLARRTDGAGHSLHARALVDSISRVRRR